MRGVREAVVEELTPVGFLESKRVRQAMPTGQSMPVREPPPITCTFQRLAVVLGEFGSMTRNPLLS